MALVSHGALVANADLGPEVLGLGPDDSTIAFLPSAHIIQRLVMELLAIRCGTPVWFSESLLRLPQELTSIEPTFFVAPPRLWERVYKTVRTEVGKKPAVVRNMVYAALGIGIRAAELRLAGKPVPRWMESACKLADRVVYRKLRERFGRNLRFAASGAAALGADLARFYMAIGLPLHEGFGLTEGGIVILNPRGRQKPGSIGKALPGVEARLAEDGELLLKSPYGFLGYFRDPAATASVMEGEWLHTGDICRLDDEGYFYITDRKKDVVVTSAGRKIYPALVESLFKTETVVNQVFLLGDNLPYPVALLTINPAGALALKGMEEYKDRSYADLTRAQAVVEEVERALSRVNRRLAEFDRIHRFRILDREFTIEEGELTATMKLRRARILENHRALIEELYRP
jgi:long-chain acyl-CoA synthetase